MHVEFVNNVNGFLLVLAAFGITFGFTGLIGLERQNIGKAAGVSAHILIAMGACAVGVLQQYMYLDAIKLATENPNLQITLENQRLICQVIAGIGFLGAGVIMKSDKHVVGLTTATTLWVSAIIGLIIGCGYFALGTILGTWTIGFIFIRDIRRHINPFRRHEEFIVRDEHEQDNNDNNIK